MDVVVDADAAAAAGQPADDKTQPTEQASVHKSPASKEPTTDISKDSKDNTTAAAAAAASKDQPKSTKSKREKSMEKSSDSTQTTSTMGAPTT